MPLKLKRKLAIGGAVVAAAGLAGGAYAASSSSTNPRQAFIDDVAKRLNVSPTALDNALKGAYQDQLNQAVKSGKLTQAQANRIKQRIAQRRLAPIGFAHRGFFGHRAGIRARGLDAAAKYLGLTDAQLLAQLRSGKSLAEIATAQHKSVSGLTSTLKADVKTGLDKAVAAKMLTSAQEQKILGRLDQRLNTLVNRKGLGHAMMHRGFRPGGPGGPGGSGLAPVAPVARVACCLRARPAPETWSEPRAGSDRMSRTAGGANCVARGVSYGPLIEF